MCILTVYKTHMPCYISIIKGREKPPNMEKEISKMTITLINKFGSYTRDARNLDTAKAFITDAIKNDGVYNASVRNENGKVVLVANKKMFGRIEFSLTH